MDGLLQRPEVEGACSGILRLRFAPPVPSGAEGLRITGSMGAQSKGPYTNHPERSEPPFGERSRRALAGVHPERS